MTDWTAGYVADIGYTFGYYTELNPLRVKLAFLSQGLVVPEMGTACELGFGQGLSANLHAAASVTQWHGTDFNPSQAGFAQELAAASGAGAKLYDDSFAEFASRPDLPDFDFIGLHGIWSWISDDNRRLIVDFIQRKLKVGGVLYISYNTLPGWASFAPMRHLMTEHAEVLGSEGRGIVSRIDGAVDFAEKLLATNPLFARANPLVADRIKKLKEQNRHYLAHEYFNKDWHPMHFASMAEWLEPAKLQFACSANYFDLVEVLNLTPEQQAFLGEIPDPMFRQSVRDFMVNQQFRKDYWVKGVRSLSPLEQTEQLRALRVVLTVAAEDVSLKVTGALGEANLTESVYRPILDALAGHKVMSIAKLEQAVQAQGVNFAQLVQALLVLCGMGAVSLAQEDSSIQKARKASDRVNQLLFSKSRSSTELNYIASPVTGGGVVLNRFQQMFAQSVIQGRHSPQDWAQYAWQVLAAQNQRIMKDGQPLGSEAENMTELASQALSFAEKQLPVLKALQVV